MRKLLEHPLVILLITIVAGIFMFSLSISSKNKVGGAKTLVTLDESVARQQQRVQELEEQVRISSDPFIQERIQRDERLQQKPGEIVLQLPAVPMPSPTPKPEVIQLSPWQEWREVLFR
ncbi:hypothetical protein KA012_01935 [Candidatus Woesebacteria bacterium]|nr:hypothetical protein [Candidatus Woesebacteria bacterium]